MSSLTREAMLRVLNISRNGPTTQETLEKLNKNWRKRPIVNLPFWGFKAHGGALMNHIPFWAGKSFLKTKKPIFGLQNSKTGYFIGQLSQDYNEYVDIVVSMAKTLRIVLDEEDIPIDIDVIPLSYVIMNTFHACSQINLLNASIVQKQRMMELRERLYAYAEKTHNMMNKASLEGSDIYLNQDPGKLNMTANIHEIEFSRAFENTFPQLKCNPAQTLLLSYGSELTHQDIKQLMQASYNDLPPIAKTNLTYEDYKQEEALFTLGKFNSRPINSPLKYVVYASDPKTNPKGLLCWVDMGSQNTLNLTLPFACRPWTDHVQVWFLRGKDPASTVGLSFAYISLKGVVV